jgi:hypothetical protein
LRHGLYIKVETYSSQYKLSQQLSAMFPIQNDLKQGGALSPLLFNFALEYTLELLSNAYIF